MKAEAIKPLHRLEWCLIVRGGEEGTGEVYFSHVPPSLVSSNEDVEVWSCSVFHSTVSKSCAKGNISRAAAHIAKIREDEVCWGRAVPAFSKCSSDSFWWLFNGTQFTWLSQQELRGALQRASAIKLFTANKILARAKPVTQPPIGWDTCHMGHSSKLLSVCAFILKH